MDYLMVDDLLLWKELGIGAVGMYVFYKFAHTVVDIVTKNAAKQMEEFHKQFLGAYKENTKALLELVVLFKDHTNSKDAAIRLLEDKYRQAK